jgi:hypothetical protein
MKTRAADVLPTFGTGKTGAASDALVGLLN